jgi:GntR family transcriptional regulator/MocR family aminotransferase
VHQIRTTSASALQLTLASGGLRRRALEKSLRTAIQEKRLAPGVRLPSTRSLASDLGLARGTVVEAYAQLRAEGYLDAQRGAGTWVTAVGASPSRAAPRVDASRRESRFNFCPGLPDLAAFPYSAWTSALRRGLRSAPASSLGYGDPFGRAELRGALAAYLARARGAVADPGLIVVCAGFAHGLSLLTRVLSGLGVEQIAMEDPCLSWHRDVASAAGLNVVSIPVDERGARSDLLASTDAGAAVVTPAHQFPLGALMKPERRAAAIAWAQAFDGLLIEDDYDAELRYDRPPVGALQALDPEHVAFVGTVSKTLAPGLRLGWLLLPRWLLEPIFELRRNEDVHVSALEQIAFTELLLSGAFERHIRRMRSRYRTRRDRLIAMLEARAPNVTPVGISAGLRVLLELPTGSPSAEEIADRGAQYSIELSPVAPCYHSGKAARDGLVVGYAALPEHAFESGLAALGDLLEATLRTSA